MRIGSAFDRKPIGSPSQIPVSQQFNRVRNDTARVFYATRGYKLFELKDHVGNIHTTITDERTTNLNNGTPDYTDNLSFNAVPVNHYSYYPFGMLMDEVKDSLNAANWIQLNTDNCGLSGPVMPRGSPGLTPGCCFVLNANGEGFKANIGPGRYRISYSLDLDNEIDDDVYLFNLHGHSPIKRFEVGQDKYFDFNFSGDSILIVYEKNNGTYANLCNFKIYRSDEDRFPEVRQGITSPDSLPEGWYAFNYNIITASGISGYVLKIQDDRVFKKHKTVSGHQYKVKIRVLPDSVVELNTYNVLLPGIIWHDTLNWDFYGQWANENYYPVAELGAPTWFELDFTAIDTISLSYFLFHGRALIDSFSVVDITQNSLYLNRQKPYKWRWNGKEKMDNNSLSTYDYGFRNYNAALGRFMSVDPLFGKFPGKSSYSAFDNNSVWKFDRDGQEPSTDVERSGNGTYKVVGGKADGDRNIYLSKNGKRTGAIIGKSLTDYSFLNDNGNAVIGAIINPNDNSGINFLNNEIIGADLFLPYYAFNARGRKKYDFKTRGIEIIPKNEENQYMYRGMPIDGVSNLDGDNNGMKTYGSARDIGNYGAGFIAGNSGMGWGASRMAFDALEKWQQRNAYASEGKPTELAERAGYDSGFKLFSNRIIKEAIKPYPSGPFPKW